MFQSINPYTQVIIESHKALGEEELSQAIKKTHLSYKLWKEVSMSDRAKQFINMAEVLRKNAKDYAILITSEMGKPIKESLAEIEKCAWLCEFYAENAEEFLKKESIKSDASESYVSYKPMGIVYAIMPWNFPFWQVLRAAVPIIIGGNTMVLKHAPNVFGCAKAIEKLFIDAGFQENIFTNLIIPVELSENVIAHPAVCGVTLTGSFQAGSIVASQAGKHMKKSVMELGGSDPYIVLKDADINQACTIGSISRMMNAGQVCISAKRFIVEESIYDEFVEQQKQILENMVLGDPMNEETQMSPLARLDLLENIEKQIEDSVKMGAKVICGGKRSDAGELFYEPTLVTNVTKKMPLYSEETFGPVSVVIKAKDADEAIQIGNDSNMGLGASLWTNDMELAKKMASKIEAGAVFINGMTKSDPRLPFGGIKESGYGRELGAHGLKEFLNTKTIWIK